MFDYQKFPVYIKSEELLTKAQIIFKSKVIDKSLKDQLYRAMTSILLNIAEGAGKFSKPDKRHFYTIARGSAYECSSIIRIIKIESNVDVTLLDSMHNDLVTISK